jgi:hypothetical protein
MRFRPIGLLLSGAVVASSACSMDTTSPSRMASPDSAALTKGKGQEKGKGLGAAPTTPTADRFAGASRTTYTVTISPNRANLLHFGPHTLDIPAKAICSEDSEYGLEMFDKECKQSKGPITITAVVRATESGIPRIDFSPALRFNPKRVVTLHLYLPDVSLRSTTGRILYCPTVTLEGCVDEAAFDRSLETHIDYRESTLFRRIKHFSGYFVES